VCCDRTPLGEQARGRRRRIPSMSPLRSHLGYPRSSAVSRNVADPAGLGLSPRDREWSGRDTSGHAGPQNRFKTRVIAADRWPVTDGHLHKNARRAAPPGSCAVPNEWNPKHVPGSAPGTGKERAPPREIRKWVVFMGVDIGGQRCFRGQGMPY
jgi:hypothetical protein